MLELGPALLLIQGVWAACQGDTAVKLRSTAWINESAGGPQREMGTELTRRGRRCEDLQVEERRVPVQPLAG